MTPSPITSWQIDGETMKIVKDFIFSGSKITANCDWRHEIKTLAPWKKGYDKPQFSSVAQPCPTLCDPMDCSTPGFPVHHQLLEFTQIHVRRVGDAILPSHPLSSPSPPAFNLTNLDDKPRGRIKKQTHYFADKGPYTQSYGFFSSHVCMWELDHKEDQMPKNWCFWTAVLEKTLESPLDCKEIKPVNLKGNQPWIFFGRTDTEAEAEAPIPWPPDAKNWLIRKDPDAGKDWMQVEKGKTLDEMLGWHHQLDGHEFEQAPGIGDWTGKPGVLQFMG